MKTLPIDVLAWLDLYRETGVRVPVNFQVVTGSMRPLIRPGCDTVTVYPVSRALNVGDIVLFERHNDAAAQTEYCLHRVFSLSGDTVTTKGDNCRLPDTPLPLSSVIGIATGINRNGKTIRLDTIGGKNAMLVRRQLYRIASRCVGVIYRCKNKLRSKVSGKKQS